MWVNLFIIILKTFFYLDFCLRLECFCKRNIWSCKTFLVHCTAILNYKFYIICELIVNIFLDPEEGHSLCPKYWINFIWCKSFLYWSIIGWMVIFLLSYCFISNILNRCSNHIWENILYSLLWNIHNRLRVWDLKCSS